jgi:hypothetical protein
VLALGRLPINKIAQHAGDCIVVMAENVSNLGVGSPLLVA